MKPKSRNSTLEIVKDYSFGFNGKELDKEGMGGGASTYDYGFRIYNSALAKFLSVDPLLKTYPMLSSYQFASNSPVQAIDLDGLEAIKVVDQSTKTTTVFINVIYVPNSESDPSAGSGFSEKEIGQIQSGINMEIEKQSFSDPNNCSEQGNCNSVIVRVNFVEVATMEEAIELRDQKGNRSVLLEQGHYVVSDGGRSVQLATTELGIVRFTSALDSHTNTHELFHSIVHFSENTPSAWFNSFDPNNQGPWHAEFGGIFQYQQTYPLSQDNINQALEATPTFYISPMGPFTMEQLEYEASCQ